MSKLLKLTEKNCREAIRARCKDCQPIEFYDTLCNRCFLHKKGDVKRLIHSYCKDCAGGSFKENCDDKNCPLFAIETLINEEICAEIRARFAKKSLDGES
jgi:hypothetical protein